MIIEVKQIFKVSMVLKFISRFNVTPIQIPTGFFLKLDKLIVKFVQKSKTSKNNQDTLKEEHREETSSPIVIS